MGSKDGSSHHTTDTGSKEEEDTFGLKGPYERLDNGRDWLSTSNPRIEKKGIRKTVDIELERWDEADARGGGASIV